MAINTDIKVSVIVPVYNVEKYLKECLDSIVNQTIKEIEIIIVDDCSTDNSLKIIKEYANNDNRIKIIELPENRGQGVARNLALDIAKGEYIAFVDPDDWIELHMLETLYNYAKGKNAEIVQFDYKIYNERKKKIETHSFAERILEITNYDIIKRPFFNWKDIKEAGLYCLGLQAWTRIYSKAFLKEHSISFAHNKRGEDHIFSIMSIFLCNKIDYLNGSFYTYRIRQGSAVNSVGKDNLLIFENLEQIRKFLIRENLYEILKFEYKEYLKKICKGHRLQTPIELLNEYDNYCLNFLSKEEVETIVSDLVPKKNILEKFLSFKIFRRNGEYYKILTICGKEFILKKYQ